MMNQTIVPLPTGENVQLFYLERQAVPQGPLAYLHHIRNPRTKSMLGLDGVEETYGRVYRASLSRFTQEYGHWSEERETGLIVSPPSSRQDAEPYRKAILSAHERVHDITQFFTKQPNVKAIQPTTTLQELIAAIETVAELDLKIFKEVVIVDELFSRGTTIAAMLHHLREAGLPKEAEVLVCAPLWLAPD